MRAQLIVPEERYILNEPFLGTPFLKEELRSITKNPVLISIAGQGESSGDVLKVESADVNELIAASTWVLSTDFSTAAEAFDGKWIIGAFPIQTCPAITLSSKFEALRLKWENDTEYVSSFSQIVTNDAYQNIIGMGAPVIPLILKQLETEGENPNHWSWALRSITGENPIPDEAAGDSSKIAEAWLTWGRDRYEW